MSSPDGARLFLRVRKRVGELSKASLKQAQDPFAGAKLLEDRSPATVKKVVHHIRQSRRHDGSFFRACRCETLSKRLQD